MVGVVSGGGYTGDLQNNGGGSWGKYRNITVTALTDALTNGYSVRVVLTGDNASAVFNASQADNDDIRIIHNIPTAGTTLSAAITSTQTTISVASVVGFPLTGMIIIDNERIGYSGISGTTLQNCIRGSSGTTGAAHVLGATVTTVQEMERYIESFTSSNITIWIKLRADIAANGSDANYRLYYSNTAAGLPAKNGKNVFHFFDDFSTDTSADYVFVGAVGTKVYDATNQILKQTNTSSEQHNLVHSSYLLPTNFMYQARVKIATDPSGRNHAGLLSNWTTAAVSGNRATHLDAVFQMGYWTNSTTYNPMTDVADGGIYADGVWLTERIYRNDGTGLFRFYATNGVGEVTVDNTTTLYTAGSLGLHSYGCEAHYDDVRVRQWVNSDTIAINGNFAVAGVEQTLGMGSGLLKINAGGITETALTVTQAGTSDILNLIDGSTEVFTVLDGGNVGIGTANPVYRLELPNIASVAGQGRANAWQTYSDVSLKTNIKPLKDSLDKILKLRGVSFKWKEQDIYSSGFIAQEVEEIIPDLVFSGEDKLKNLDYSRFTPYLVEAIKQQQEQIDILKKEIIKLQ
jgi:hypothetical protein